MPKKKKPLTNKQFVANKQAAINKKKMGESKIRQALLSVLEGGRLDNKDDYDEKFRGKGAKDMKKDHMKGDVDDTLKFQEQIIDIDTIGKNLLARYYNMLFDPQYGLPCSVIKECVDNKDSELWKKICTQKGILGGTINMPKNYCS